MRLRIHTLSNPNNPEPNNHIAAGAGTGEAFNSGAVIGDLAATIANRTPMKQAYFLTDPSAAYVTVAYILNT